MLSLKPSSPSCVGQNETKNHSSSVTSKRLKMQNSFPVQLMEILSREGYSNIIMWLPHGKSFIVKDKKKFISIVSPCYFQETKFESFLRKLNRWGFVRISTGDEKGAFYQKLFLRDDPLLSFEIHCNNSNKRKKQVKDKTKINISNFKKRPPVENIELDKSKQYNMSLYGMEHPNNFEMKNDSGNIKTTNHRVQIHHGVLEHNTFPSQISSLFDAQLQELKYMFHLKNLQEQLNQSIARKLDLHTRYALLPQELKCENSAFNQVDTFSPLQEQLLSELSFRSKKDALERLIVPTSPVSLYNVNSTPYHYQKSSLLNYYQQNYPFQSSTTISHAVSPSSTLMPDMLNIEHGFKSSLCNKNKGGVKKRLISRIRDTESKHATCA